MFKAWCLTAFTLIGSFVAADDAALDIVPAENIESSLAGNSTADSSQIQAVIADNSTTTSSDTSQAQDCALGPQAKRFIFRHLEGEGLGFNKGYTTFEAFLSTSEAWWDNFFPFFDLRAHAFNDGRPAANLGVGGRYLFDSGCHALGGNIYYDFRKTDHHRYNQVGCGLEWLAPRWEIRANGYFPIGNTTSRHFDLEFDHFSNHYLYVRTRKEFAMMGGDIEAGWHFMRMGKVDLFVGGGPYYFKGKIGHAAIGGKVRFVARLGKYFTLEATDTYDSTFNNRVNGQLSINFPFGPKSKVKKSNSCSCDQQMMLQESIYDYPERDEIIVTHSRHKTQKAYDSEGNPLFFWFVNNTSSSAGTFQSPFPTLLQAQTASSPGDTIYVFPGDGTATGMSIGIILKDNQRFLSSAVSHNFSTQLGNVEIPALTEARPRIGGTQPFASATVRIVNNNEVSGFLFDGTIPAGGPGITGAYLGSQTVANINRNIIMDYASGGVVVTMAGDSQGTFLIDSNTILRGFSTGVDFNFVADSGVNVTIQNNTFDNIIGGGINVSIPGSTTIPYDSTVNINNNTIIDSVAEGIFVHAFGPVNAVNTQIFGNTLSYSTSTPIVIRVENRDDTDHTVNIWQNTINQMPGSTSPSIYAARTPSFASSGQFIVRIAENTMHNGEGITVSETSNGPGFTQATIISNNIFNTQTEAIGLTSTDGGGVLPPLLTAVVQSNNIDTVGSSLSPLGNGIEIFSTGGAFTENILDVSVINNTITNVAQSGINCAVVSGVARTQFMLNTVNNCGLFTATQPAFFYTNAGQLEISVLSNFFQDNLGGDFRVDNTGAGPTCLRLNENVTSFGYILDNSGGGIFNLEPPVGNVGVIFPIGTITPVPAGTCN